MRRYYLATCEAEWIFDVNGHNRTLLFQKDSWVARLQQEGVLDARNAWSWAYFNAISQMLAISVRIAHVLPCLCCCATQHHNA